MPKRRYHFADGHVANRIIDALNHCTVAQVADLGRKGLLDLENFNHMVTAYGLKYEGLSDYATLAGVPAISFFYDENDPIQPIYTPYDSEVRTIISLLNPHSLSKLYEFMTHAYALNSWDFKAPPSDKIHYLLKYQPELRDQLRNEPELVHPKYCRFQTDLKKELDRYAITNRFSNKITFRSDYYADTAVYLGVSLHWIMSLEVPFLFDTDLADKVFDYFTLMTPDMQKSFMNVVSGYLREEVKRMNSMMDFLKGGSGNG